jgi:hypothetical protein
MNHQDVLRKNMLVNEVFSAVTLEFSRDQAVTFLVNFKIGTIDGIEVAHSALKLQSVFFRKVLVGHMEEKAMAHQSSVAAEIADEVNDL